MTFIKYWQTLFFQVCEPVIHVTRVLLIKFTVFGIGKHWGLQTMTRTVIAGKEVSINHGDSVFYPETNLRTI